VQTHSPSFLQLKLRHFGGIDLSTEVEPVEEAEQQVADRRVRATPTELRGGGRKSHVPVEAFNNVTYHIKLPC